MSPCHVFWCRVVCAGRDQRPDGGGVERSPRGGYGAGQGRGGAGQAEQRRPQRPHVRLQRPRSGVFVCVMSCHAMPCRAREREGLLCCSLPTDVAQIKSQQTTGVNEPVKKGNRTLFPVLVRSGVTGRRQLVAAQPPHRLLSVVLHVGALLCAAYASATAVSRWVPVPPLSLSLPRVGFVRQIQTDDLGCLTKLSYPTRVWSGSRSSIRCLACSCDHSEIKTILGGEAG